ncbi:MAG: hypothetical protein HYX61_00460 [Gammaproteobacteria bacterium]|jgi:hypothetical protein|nr:hypothetical protein [Gammaproteobacteria bacterium]
MSLQGVKEAKDNAPNFDLTGSAIPKPVIEETVKIATDIQPQITEAAEKANKEAAEKIDKEEQQAKANLKLEEEHKRNQLSDAETTLSDEFNAAIEKHRNQAADEERKRLEAAKSIPFIQQTLASEAVPVAQALIPGISHRMEDAQRKLDAENEIAAKLAAEHKELEEQRIASIKPKEEIKPRRSARLSALGTGAPAVVPAKPKGTKINALIAAFSDAKETPGASNKEDPIVPAGKVKSITAGFQKFKDEQEAEIPQPVPHTTHLDTAVRQAKRKLRF